MHYTLTGLTCNNCAFKIEQELRKVKGLEAASIDFTTRSLEIPPGFLEEAREVLARIEPTIKVQDPINNQAAGIYEEVNKTRLYSVVVASLLLLVGLVFNTTLRQTAFHWAEHLVLMSAYLLVGWPVFAKALRNLVRIQIFNENFLMSAATLGAVALHHLNEAVAVMLFYAVGELFQEQAVNRSRRSIAALMNIRPDYANLHVNGEIIKVSPEEVKVGQTIIIKPGEKVPLDGHVIDGVSFVDTAVLTGESIPRKVAAGKKVLAGMVNGQGLLTVRVSKPFGESSVARIMELVENAASRKAPTDQFITTFARYYTPVVSFAALALALLPPLLSGAAFDTWIYRALVLLIISCPCALVISVPLGYFGGLGSVSRQGILVKGANFLEALAGLTTVVFDKTGTLTKGVFQVNRVVPANGFNKEQILAFAAAAESCSNHPIAQSICQAYGQEFPLDKISDYQELTGRGISAVVNGKKVLVGNERILQGKKDQASQVEGTRVHVVIAGIYAGCIIIADEIKDNTKEAINRLKEIGIKHIVMLTGDDKTVARGVATSLGLESYYAELLPEEKVQRVEELRSALPNPKKQKLAFVGDGINDAPVLARADVGIAMGALGADAAIEAADVVLMDDNPAKLVTAVKIARYINRIVRQNVVLALGLKAFFLLLGAFGLASIWEAVFADVGVTLIAILNATHTLKYEGN